MNKKRLFSYLVVAMMVFTVIPASESDADKPVWASDASGFVFECKNITQDQFDEIRYLDRLVEYLIDNMGINMEDEEYNSIFNLNYEINNISYYSAVAAGIHHYDDENSPYAAALMRYVFNNETFDLDVTCTVNEFGDGVEIINTGAEFVQCGNSLTDKFGREMFAVGDSIHLKCHVDSSYFDDWSLSLLPYEGSLYWNAAESNVYGYTDIISGVEMTWNMVNSGTYDFTGMSKYNDNTMLVTQMDLGERTALDMGDIVTIVTMYNTDYSDKETVLYDDEGKEYKIKAFEHNKNTTIPEYKVNEYDLIDVSDYETDESLINYWFGDTDLNKIGKLTKGYDNAKLQYNVCKEKYVHTEPYLYDALNSNSSWQPVLLVSIIIIIILAIMYIKKN